MKIFSVFLFFLISTITLSQNMDGKGKHSRKRFIELEKIKLIETLNLSEDIVVKFFARRNKFKNEMRNIHDSKDAVLDKIEEAISEGTIDQKFPELQKELKRIELKLVERKIKFIDSLPDILNQDQIAKLIIFERNFKRDIKQLLIEKGRKKYRRDRDLN